MHYLYFIKVRVLLSLTYRFETLSTVFIQLILLVINSFFWKAVYGNSTGTSDISLEQMLIYTVISSLMSSFFCKSVENVIRNKVREGNVAVDLIKPLDMFGMYFASDVGDIIVNLCLKALPMFIFASIFIAIPVPASFFHLLLFLLSVIVSFLIIWLIAAIFGMINFWVIDIGPLGGVKDYIITFLSGSIVPTWFFPDWAAKILTFTPFIYIYQMPISIFIGKTGLLEGLYGIGIQSLWCFLFFALFTFMKRKTVSSLIVQGG